MSDGTDNEAARHRPVEAQPADEGRVSELLTAAHAEGVAVLVSGGGTKSGWGNPASRCDLVLHVSGLRGFTHADADNLTLSAAAGTTIAEARAQARSMGRVLPLDPRYPARATVGGVAATADQGARAAGYGGVRDVVLGLRAVLADGSAVKFGGLTMKNVAGYDMTRLFVGSFGILGVITEVTFRLLPRPETQAVAILPLPSMAEAGSTVGRILDSHLEPLALEVVSRGSGEFPLLVAGFAGHPAAVERSIRDVRKAHPVPAQAVLRDTEAEELYEALASAGPGAAGTNDRPSRSVGARASLPLSRVIDFIEAAEAAAESHGLTLTYRGSAARGVVDLYVSDRSPEEPRPAATPTPPGSPPAPPRSAAGPCLSALRAHAVARGGSLIITERSDLLSAGFDAWGDPGPAVTIMRRLKERFDPRSVLNPGRFVGGI